MNVSKSKVYTVAGWILFVAALLYIKDRREKAYWKEVTERISAQLEPKKIPEGDAMVSDFPSLSDVVLLRGAAPAGMGEREQKGSVQ